MTQVCLIVGGGQAAATLATDLRRQGWAGEITMVSAEPTPPYHRPPLSKTFLAGEQGAEALHIRPPAAYEQAGARLLLNRRVTAIDRAARVAQLDDGVALAYDKLALTVGARVRAVDLPGADLPGVCYLRSLADAERIRRRIRPGGAAVIVGGGYIGLETAAVLNKCGMRATVLEAQPRVLQRVTAAPVSAFYTRLHEEAGVAIRCDTGVAAFAGRGKVERVVCADGAELSAELVVVGVGIEPETALAAAAGLEVENGIKVDGEARTSDADIYAAGDCAWQYNSLYERWLRLESVQNASEQARIAALSISGKIRGAPAADGAVPWFWSDQYDVKLQIAGLSQGCDRLVLRGDPKRERSFAAFYLRGGRLLAVDAVNKAAEFMFGKKLIAAAAVVDEGKLADAAFPLRDLL